MLGCAVVDKQLQLDKQLSSLNSTLEEKFQNRVETRDAIEIKFKEITDQLQESLNEFSSKCIVAVRSLNSQAGTELELGRCRFFQSVSVFFKSRFGFRFF